MLKNLFKRIFYLMNLTKNFEMVERTID